MDNRYTVYLAGPMTGLTYKEANNWRQEINTALGDTVHCLSPLRDQVESNNDKPIQNSYSRSLFCNDRAITMRDWNDVKRADVIVVNFTGATKASIGTVIEIGWASEMGKPIVVIMEKGNIHNHAIIRDLTWVVPDLKTAVKVVKSIFDI